MKILIHILYKNYIDYRSKIVKKKKKDNENDMNELVDDYIIFFVRLLKINVLFKCYYSFFYTYS